MTEIDAETMKADIDAWVAAEIEEEGPSMVPDFWDEMDTSARLADWLTGLGYRKVG